MVPAALPIDRLSRTLGFHRVALDQVPTLDADVLGTITAYVAGVNAGRASSPRPHELVLLRAKPSAWTVEDVLALGGLQSLALGGSWDTDLARLAILDADGPEALAAVEPPYAAWQPAVTPAGRLAGEPLARIAEDLSRLRDLVGVRRVERLGPRRIADRIGLSDPGQRPAPRAGGPAAVVPRASADSGVGDRRRLVRRRARLPHGLQWTCGMGHHGRLH